jgi:hypothetical protein
VPVEWPAAVRLQASVDDPGYIWKGAAVTGDERVLKLLGPEAEAIVEDDEALETLMRVAGLPRPMTLAQHEAHERVWTGR